MGKIVLFLMNEKGFFVLENLLRDKGAEVLECVITSQDLNIKKDYYDDIIELCKAYSIPCYNKANMPDLDGYKGYKVAIGWRWMIQGDISRLVVLHDSLLPKYRGFAPLANMLINKEPQIGVTALFAGEEFDDGDIIDSRSAMVNYPIKIEEAIQIVKYLYYEIVAGIVDKLQEQIELPRIKQDNTEVSYSCWRDKDDYIIDWNSWDVDKIARVVDAVGFPYEGARTSLNGEQIIIDEAAPHRDYHVEAAEDHIGKMLFVQNQHPFVVCKDGLLEIISAHYLDGKSILPLKKYRSRFGK
ncbi:methionyl-tRNA formyltransferase [Lachnospiraceae bacterium XBD2001]|nr:methionyl-tRNA formyltransferase [Lachnospiraceae bacterium XBD2001]